MMLVRALVRLSYNFVSRFDCFGERSPIDGGRSESGLAEYMGMSSSRSGAPKGPKFPTLSVKCHLLSLIQVFHTDKSTRLIALTTNLDGFQNTSAQPLCYQPLPHSWRMSTWPEQNNSLNFPHCTSYVFTNKTLEAEARNSVLHNAKIRQSFSLVNMTHRQGCSLESFAFLTSTFMVSSNFYINCSRVVCTVELLMIPELPSYLQRNWPLSKLQPTEV